MIVSWNTRGLNNIGKLKEISSHLHELRPNISILIETRVKRNNAEKVRAKLNLPGSYANNYTSYANGRIWIHWNDSNIDLKIVKRSSQYIHCGVYSNDGTFRYWLTAIYAHNQLEHRRILWKNLDMLFKSQQGAWCVLGDFNNVLTARDRGGGNLVTEKEYEDLHNMMDATGLGEMDNTGEFFTWSNKQSSNPIYSRIDRVLVNVQWFQENVDAVLHIHPPSISDHALLHISIPKVRTTTRIFRFSNHLTDLDDYDATVKHSWLKPARGRPMCVLWYKLQRLQRDLRNLHKPKNDIKRNIEKFRVDLLEAQNSLRTNRLDGELIDKVKRITDELIKWNALEESRLRKQTKVDWLRKGDDNSTFFYALLKAKQKRKTISMLKKADGSIATNQEDIEKEVMDFYGGLMGTGNQVHTHIDIQAMREGKQLTWE
ncbi:uncharacterized protein LOC131651282 [Vicia villosa]|uniref:uncharacterized protein LOC131651282 n=1 Tax=Vicia villosa TaxID=3911 RepID=UPI00273A78F0|nr:uncharacterized protein LOC131651282 [Vicia villosa]